MLIIYDVAINMFLPIVAVLVEVHRPVVVCNKGVEHRLLIK